MELKKINYGFAMYFGVFALVMYLILGILQLILVRQMPEYQALVGNVGALQLLVYAPIIGGFVAYLFMLLAIFVYNKVAVKFPISWTVKK